MIVALVGPARSGKSTVANLLRDRYGFEVVGFADALKEMALAIDPTISWTNDDDPVRLSEIIDRHGWEYAKDTFPEVRRFLQYLGTDGVRRTFGDDAWVDVWERRIAGHENVAVPDCRFTNEASRVRSAGGVVWRVVRDGFEPKSDHPSEVEQASIAADVIIHNVSLDRLPDQIAIALSRSA